MFKINRIYSYLFNTVGVVLLCLIAITATFGQQKYKLASEYYNSGEYEKAASIYQSLFKENPENKSYFNLYLQCLIDLRDYSKAQKVINEEQKKDPKDLSLYVSSGNLLERQGETEKAKQEYKKAIDNLVPDPGMIGNLANTFTSLAKYELAVETLLKGTKMTGVPNMFSYNLADLYRRQGDVPNMVKYYLVSAEAESNSFNIQTSLQRYLSDSNYVELQKQLYKKIQDFPNQIVFGELLQWSFMQQKDYSKALRQARAMDRQNDENGMRVFNLAPIALQDNDFDTAIEAYNYILTTKGRNTSYYMESKRGVLNAKKMKVTERYDYTKEDLNVLKNEYKSFFNEVGKNTQTAQLLQEFADFEALYLNELDTAIILLEELKTFAGLQTDQVARAKIALADYYLMSGDRWEASLLYSQVDKDFKEGVLGEIAREKNARLSYYSGDFEWAQEQFKIIKGATSKLISNDAIDMSVFILDNLGLDTTEVTLYMFAQAELLAFQNKYDEAIVKLDSIAIIFPDHTLEDDVLFTKARIYKKLRMTDKAIAMYEAVINKFPEEIRADNACFELAEMYENNLKQPDKARALYKKIFEEYSGSTFAVEARARYRKLRGDEL